MTKERVIFTFVGSGFRASGAAKRRQPRRDGAGTMPVEALMEPAPNMMDRAGDVRRWGRWEGVFESA